jgi:hypothetical protein
VDGVIAAATRSIGTTEGVRYEAVLPPRVYEGDVGEVQVLLLDKRGELELLGES